MHPELIKGNRFSDHRGTLTFNNDINLNGVKRIYIIENNDIDLERGWQGHQIEQRWFSSIAGSFTVTLIRIDNFTNPSKDLQQVMFILDSEKLDILHVPSGYISCIQANSKDSKLLCMSDYMLGEIEDDFKFPLDYFKNK